MTTRLLEPGYQVFDANGGPVSGALYYTYDAGTDIPKATYSDAGLTIPNANPVEADAGGRFGPVFADAGDYKIVMKTSGGSILFTADPVFGTGSGGSAAGSGIRNLIVNGGMDFNQRVATSVANDTYCLDAWYVLTNTGNVTVAQQSLQAFGIPTNVRLTQPDAAPKYLGYAQIIENTNCRAYKNADVVLSARVRHSLTAPIRYALLSWTSTADAVTSDVVNNWGSASYTAGGFFLGANLTVQAVGVITPGAGLWTSISPITATLSGSMNNLVVMFWTENVTAQNATLDISNVMVNAGTTAEGFEYLPRDTIAAHCYRYYQKSFSLATAPAQNTEPITAHSLTQSVGASTVQAGNLIKLVTPMRTNTFTITLYNPSAANAEARNLTAGADCSATAASQAGTEKIVFTTTTPAGTSAGQRLLVHYTVDNSL